MPVGHPDHVRLLPLLLAPLLAELGDGERLFLDGADLLAVRLLEAGESRRRHERVGSRSREAHLLKGENHERGGHAVAIGDISNRVQATPFRKYVDFLR